jgi:hypothetical protein
MDVARLSPYQALGRPYFFDFQRTITAVKRFGRETVRRFRDSRFALRPSIAGRSS